MFGGRSGSILSAASTRTELRCLFLPLARSDLSGPMSRVKFSLRQYRPAAPHAKCILASVLLPNRLDIPILFLMIPLALQRMVLIASLQRVLSASRLWWGSAFARQLALAVSHRLAASELQGSSYAFSQDAAWGLCAALSLQRRGWNASRLSTVSPPVDPSARPLPQHGGTSRERSGDFDGECSATRAGRRRAREGQRRGETW